MAWTTIRRGNWLGQPERSVSKTFFKAGEFENTGFADERHFKKEAFWKWYRDWWNWCILRAARVSVLKHKAKINGYCLSFKFPRRRVNGKHLVDVFSERELHFQITPVQLVWTGPATMNYKVILAPSPSSLFDYMLSYSRRRSSDFFKVIKLYILTEDSKKHEKPDWSKI